MKTVSAAALVACSLVLGALGLGAAELTRFRHLASVYVDEQGGGLKFPEGIACDDKGAFVVGDTGNDRLVRFSLSDGTVKGGTEIKLPQLSAPTRVQFAPGGAVYALDGKRRRVVLVGPQGEFQGEVAFEGVPAPATVVPKSFALDSAGNVFVLDEFSARILVFDADRKFKRAAPLPAEAGFVTDLTVDVKGTVFLVDSLKRGVYAAAEGAAAFGAFGKSLGGVLNTMPTGITTARGTVFITEGRGSTIVTLGSDGTFLARQLTAGWSDGSLNYPSQLCINGADQAFVADRDNSRVQVFTLSR